jgi:hypothetical protein
MIFRHTGGNKFEPVNGDNWDIVKSGQCPFFKKG